MLRPFDYHRPKSLGEACSLLVEHDATILAGGTDLLVKIRDGKHPVKTVVDIKGIDSLRGIHREGRVFYFGALTTITDLITHEALLAEPALGNLVDAGRLFGCHEIRHRATVCGNIAHASPGSEYGSPMFVLEAEVLIHGPTGERVLPIHEFYRGATWNALEPGEILTALRVTLPPEGSRSCYLRRSRVKGMDLAGLNLSCLVIRPDDPKERKVRIAMGAVHKVPMRPEAVEAMLSGTAITSELLADARKMLSEGIHPRPSSMRAGPEYKKAMIAHLAEEALRRCIGPMPEEVKA